MSATATDKRHPPSTDQQCAKGPADPSCHCGRTLTTCNGCGSPRCTACDPYRSDDCDIGR